jgi:AraC family transcriptional regulator, transcriptional activator of pobA
MGCIQLTKKAKNRTLRAFLRSGVAMKSVPNFALYGDAAKPSWVDMVHYERIPVRSAMFHWDIAPHFHDALIQVLYLTAGGGETFMDDRKWALKTPCLIVAPARAVHGFRFSQDCDGPVITAAQRPLESLAALAAPELLQVLRRPAVLEVDPQSRHAEALLPLFDAIERESMTHAPGQVAAGMSLLVALFVQIARISQGVQTSEGQNRSRKAATIERFRTLMDERCRQRVPVESYAQELGVSLGQLTRLCREVLGMSTIEAINARVVHEARRELVYSSLSVKQVAAELGFDDEAYFGRFFKKQTGMRPTEFRVAARGSLVAA